MINKCGDINLPEKECTIPRLLWKWPFVMLVIYMHMFLLGMNIVYIKDTSKVTDGSL